jgi:hypothetical protein
MPAVSVRFRVMLGRRFGVMDCVQFVAMRDMRVVTGSDVIP